MATVLIGLGSFFILVSFAMWLSEVLPPPGKHEGPLVCAGVGLCALIAGAVMAGLN